MSDHNVIDRPRYPMLNAAGHLIFNSDEDRAAWFLGKRVTVYDQGCGLVVPGVRRYGEVNVKMHRFAAEPQWIPMDDLVPHSVCSDCRPSAEFFAEHG